LLFEFVQEMVLLTMTASPPASTRFSDNYELREELGNLTNEEQQLLTTVDPRSVGLLDKQAFLGQIDPVRKRI
ncbi:hypothetical protein T4A_3268, partial [Trichinella pseudospiralis]